MYVFSDCDSLAAIYSLNPLPPTVEDTAEDPCFLDIHYQNATLYVPQGALEAYRTAKTWSRFLNIQSLETTGINGIEADGGDGRNVYYDMNGRKSATPHRGVNIVRHPDGTTHKVILK